MPTDQDKKEKKKKARLAPILEAPVSPSGLSVPTDQDHVLTFEHVQNFSGQSLTLQDHPIHEPQCDDHTVIRAKTFLRQIKTTLILVGRRSSPEGETGALPTG